MTRCSTRFRGVLTAHAHVECLHVCSATFASVLESWSFAGDETGDETAD